MARTLGVGWWSVMRAVIEVGRPLVEDPARLEAVVGLGVDEHAWQRANAVRHTQYATGVVGLRAGRSARLLEVVQGRSGGVYGDWLAARPEAWREQIRVAALDPFRGYLNALREHLPDAAHVLDAFHVTALGMKVVDEVRRRVQQETLGRRGHKDDPLYQIRRVLRRRADRLTPSAMARLDTALAAGDPDGEVSVAWWAAQVANVLPAGKFALLRRVLFRLELGRRAGAAGVLDPTAVRAQERPCPSMGQASDLVGGTVLNQ